MSSETLQQQFENVKKETNTSHVMEYGDLTMGSLVLDQFQGNDNNKHNNAKKSPQVPVSKTLYYDLKFE